VDEQEKLIHHFHRKLLFECGVEINSERYPAQIFLTAPATKSDAPPQQLQWSITDGGKEAGEVELTVYMEYNGVPQ
jgi:hypothetical protein